METGNAVLTAIWLDSRVVTSRGEPVSQDAITSNGAEPDALRPGV
jgi:hypothetical protein